MLFWLHRLDPPQGVQRAHVALFPSISSDRIDPRSQACPRDQLPLIDLLGSPSPPRFPTAAPDRYTKKQTGSLPPWTPDPRLALWSSEGLASLVLVALASQRPSSRRTIGQIVSREDHLVCMKKFCFARLGKGFSA
jgi:hypothetical protein